VRRGPARALAIASSLGGATTLAVLVHPLGHSSAPASDRAELASLPSPPKPLLAVSAPRPLRDDGAATWAPVRRPTIVRATPRTDGRVVGELTTRTPEGTTNIVLVLGRTEDEAGRLWIQTRLPVLPNDTVGWVERRALGGYGTVDTRLVVDLERLRATLYRHRRAIFDAPVGVGTAAAPTPRGHFYIRNKLTGYRSAFYGPIAFGTSARSAVLTDWPAGGYIGIHGTDAPQLIPGRISHGCIRLRNPDILRLSRLMPVGTPLTIE
jgi:hypothetical protein